MSSLADVDCFLKRSGRSLPDLAESPRGLLTDLLASPSSGYGSSGSGSGGHSGGYSSGYGHQECCPLVVDPKTLLTLLALGAAATYLLQ